VIALLVLAAGCADITVELAFEPDLIDPMGGGHAYGTNGEDGADTDTGSGAALAWEQSDAMTEAGAEAVQRWRWSGRAPMRLRGLQGAVGGEVVLADINGDTRLDVLALSVPGDSGRAELTVWPGTPLGPGVGASVPLPLGMVEMRVGDVTGDGTPDLVLGGPAGLQVLPGLGSAGFGAATADAFEDPVGLLGLVDLVGDRALEAVVIDVTGTPALRVLGADEEGNLRELGAVELATAPSVPFEVVAYTLPGRSGSVAVLAEGRADSTAARFLAWDHASGDFAVTDLDVVRAACLGCPLIAAYGDDLDGDGASELVSTGLTGLYAWDAVRSEVTEVHAADPALDQALALAGTDLDGDGEADALELIAHGPPGTPSDLRLQPSMARGGALEPTAPFPVAVAPTSLVGQVLAVGPLDDDDCADVVLLDGTWQPWLIRGQCRLEAP
jgi:hypothetical protein